MVRRTLATVALLMLATLPVFSQMFRLQGGAGTLSGSQGTAFTVYQPNSTSSVGFSYANGPHIGFSRSVQMGNTSMVVGDTNLVLRMPTDIAGDGRALMLRGVTLGTQHVASSTQPAGISSFVGWTGNSYSSAFQSAVQPTNPIQLLTGHIAFNKSFDMSAVAVHGTRSSLLASGRWTHNQRTDAAVTAGVTGGVPMLIARARTGGNTWKGEASYTTGAVRLQPEPELLTATVERVGLNGTVSKRVGSWLQVDAGRQEYNTADAIDAPSFGITAARSAMYEGGVTLRHGPLQGGVRLLQSSSGSQTSGGEVLIAGWQSRTVNVLGTGIRSHNVDGSITTSASIDTTERVTPRLKLTEVTTFANGAPTFDFGGGYEGPWGSVNVDHRETYIPFGIEAGFHRVLSLSVRLHIRSTEVGGDQVIARGLPLLINFSGDSFLGSDLGPIATPESRMASLPKFAVEGIVSMPSGDPVRGAAVKAGSQVVYTDSSGHFLMRFSQARPVELSTEPSLFLTPESYARVDGLMTVTPGRDGEGSQVMLHVDRAAPDASVPTETDGAMVVDSEVDVDSHRPGLLQRTWSVTVKLCRAMVRAKG